MAKSHRYVHIASKTCKCRWLTIHFQPPENSQRGFGLFGVHEIYITLRHVLKIYNSKSIFTREPHGRMASQMGLTGSPSGVGKFGSWRFMYSRWSALWPIIYTESSHLGLSAVNTERAVGAARWGFISSANWRCSLNFGLLPMVR